MDLYFASNNNLLTQIGEKVRGRRVAACLTQRQLAEQAGVALSAIGNIEKGGNCSLLTLIQVLRTLKSLDLIESFFRQEEISPIAYAEQAHKKSTPQRVRTSKQNISSNLSSSW